MPRVRRELKGPASSQANADTRYVPGRAGHIACLMRSLQLQVRARSTRGTTYLWSFTRHQGRRHLAALVAQYRTDLEAQRAQLCLQPARLRRLNTAPLRIPKENTVFS